MTADAMDDQRTPVGGRGGPPAEPSGRHGVIGLDPTACTVCMVCAEECPAWCIEIGSHVELDTSGRRPVRRAVLDVFTIDYGLCMYCGICVEACPFDALAWASTPTPAEVAATALRHDAARLATWWPATEG